MSFVIDENAVRRLLEEKGGANTYTVTASNLLVSSMDPSPNPMFSMGIYGTTASAMMEPRMSPETVERLRSLRQRIVESGSPLMTTEELDSEITQRKRQLPGE